MLRLQVINKSIIFGYFFFFKQKTAYEIYQCDWSSDVCSSDLFGNEVAIKYPCWIINPELLPPNVVGGKSKAGRTAADLKTELVGKIVQGTAYSSAEVYQSGVVTLPLQVKVPLARLRAMNGALGDYSAALSARWKHSKAFTPFEPMPGNSFDPKSTAVCWR